ncbi:hypothetical protein PanWU01x14_340940, partial [Parasponia andersonii]
MKPDGFGPPHPQVISQLRALITDLFKHSSLALTQPSIIFGSVFGSLCGILGIIFYGGESS